MSKLSWTEKLAEKNSRDREQSARNDDLSDDFGTLLFLGEILSFLGWVVLVISILVALISFFTTEFIIAGGALLGIPIGLLVVAGGQMISCFVSTERNTKDTHGVLKQILDKMEDKPNQQEEDKEKQ